MLEILRELYSKYFGHFDDESDCKYVSDDEENASFNIDVFEEAPGGVPRSLLVCTFSLENILCGIVVVWSRPGTFGVQLY